jgi:lysophospholipase L1-like esterase
VEIAAAPVDKRVPTLVYSDEMPLLETDGSLELSGKILFVRDYSRGGHSADRFDANTPSLRESSRYGFGGGWVNTETESTPGHFINPGHFHDAAGPGWVCVGFHVPHALLCITDSPAITILQTGDSINSGVSSSNGLLSPAWYAAELLRGTIGMSTHVVNQALSGDISHNYIRRAQFSLTGLQPSVAVIQTYSRNDQVVFGDTIGVAKAAYDRALDLRAQCQAFGILPILETSCPFAGRSAFETFETNRNFINGLVRGSGHPFVDYDVILGSGGVPNAFLPGLSEDGIHPTTNGIKQMGQALFDVIRTHRLQMKFGGF